MTVKIYKREDSDTTPRGFGNKPTYHIDEWAAKVTDTSGMVWVEPIELDLPDGYCVDIGNDGLQHVYNQKGNYVRIIDNGHGKPRLIAE